jgi:hypothetical protein
MARRVAFGLLLALFAIGALTWWAGEQTEARAVPAASAAAP